MAVMKLIHETQGEYTFPQEKIPLLSRRISAERIHPQSGGHRRIEFSLTGFFTGSNHEETLAQYEALMSRCNGSRLILYYENGNGVVLNQAVYIDSVSDPPQWKQRLADWAITGYYFTTLDPSYSGITASFTSPAGNYTFTQTPVLQIAKRRMRASPRGWETLPSGSQIGAEVNLQIASEICADEHSVLLTMRSQVETAFSRDGTFNFGELSFACHINSINWAPAVPLNYWPFQIDATYFINGLLMFNADIAYSRVNKSPIIHENPACTLPPYIVNRFKEARGQYVDYHFEAEGESLSTVRTLLLSEIAALVYPGGTEIDGGREHHVIQEPKINLTFTRFYYPPVLPNIDENMFV